MENMITYDVSFVKSSNVGHTACGSKFYFHIYCPIGVKYVIKR